MSTIKVDTIATRTGSGNITLSNSLASVTINRTGNGVAQTIQNGGTTVGEIGVNSTDNMFLVSTNTGFKLLKDEAAIAPAQSGGSNHDNALDLGFSTVRWKDLYLSGGAFIGGATAANKLDDYEEGTFTPALAGASSISHTTQSGAYTKIGQTVIAHFHLNIASVSGGSNYRILGWPFTPKGSASNVYGGWIRRQSALTQTDADKYIDFYNASLNMYVYTRAGSAYSSAGHWQAGIFTGVAVYDVD